MVQAYRQHVRENLLLAMDTLRTHKFRSFLTVLGVLIGTTTVIAVTSIIAGLDKQLERDLLLFPLDNTCNWMVDSAMHPGSCAVSMAVLCAGERAKEVVDWAFSEQEKIHAASLNDKDAAARIVEERFPDFKTCMVSSVTKARLAQSLRWAVRNQVPVLTPQLYVDNHRLCDEDTDLGLEYTLSHMLKGTP